MPPDIKSLLFDMQQAAIGIELFVDGKTPETAEMISEYRGIISLRNVLSHGYDAINVDTTWQIIQNKLPILRREVERLLNEP